MRSIKNTRIVARYGGEEFVILIPESTQDEALQLAEKIRRKIEKHQILSIADLTLSIGVTEINFNQDKSFKDMLKRADKALYRAKNKGRNNVVHL